MSKQTKRWLGYGSGAIIGAIVLAMFRIVWPSAILAVLAIICAIQARRSDERRANRRTPRLVEILLLLVLVGVPCLMLVTAAVTQRRWDDVVFYIMMPIGLVGIVLWPPRSRPTQK